jgi:hypothetical protein
MIILIQPITDLVGQRIFHENRQARSHSLARLFSDSRSVRRRIRLMATAKRTFPLVRPSNRRVAYISIRHRNFNRAAGCEAWTFGIASDRSRPPIYDGDFITDIAVFREGAPAYFYILQSRTNTFRAEPFGTTGDVPVPGDYDGDNKADVAVYRQGVTAGAQSYFIIVRRRRVLISVN